MTWDRAMPKISTMSMRGVTLANDDNSFVVPATIELRQCK